MSDKLPSSQLLKMILKKINCKSYLHFSTCMQHFLNQFFPFNVISSLRIYIFFSHCSLVILKSAHVVFFSSMYTQKNANYIKKERTTLVIQLFTNYTELIIHALWLYTHCGRIWTSGGFPTLFCTTICVLVTASMTWFVLNIKSPFLDATTPFS